MNTLNSKLADFCRLVLTLEANQGVVDPARLGETFREYLGITRTPSVKSACEIVRSLGIEITAAGYLDTGGVNMMAAGKWHIHYSSKDKAETQKFDIFHELFEVIYKNLDMTASDIKINTATTLCRAADRFAASVLIPPDYFIKHALGSGCDLVKLAGELGLSHQCLLIALREHFSHIPLVGALYELKTNGNGFQKEHARNYRATVVVKTSKAQTVRKLCKRQNVPARSKCPEMGSLVCAALKSGRTLLWREAVSDGSAAVLVRPLYSGRKDIYRAVLLAVPDNKYHIISPQADSLDVTPVNGSDCCPAGKNCGSDILCNWKTREEGDYYGS